MSETISEARAIAEAIHLEQMYGFKPYINHLQDVVDLCEDLLGNGKLWSPLKAHRETIVASAWLHDALEDTDFSLDELHRGFGPDVANIVWAVTGADTEDQKKQPRGLKNNRIYWKLGIVSRLAEGTPTAKIPPYETQIGWERLHLCAQLVKAVDRLANVASCWITTDARLFMYHREYPEFRSETGLSRATDPVLVFVLDRLDTLLGFRK